MRHILAIFILAVTCLACQRSTESTKVITSREYEVYRFLVNHFDDSTRYAIVVIKDSTFWSSIRRGDSFPIPDSVFVRFQPLIETTDFHPSKILLDSLQRSSRLRVDAWSRHLSPADSALHVQGKTLFLGFSRVVFDSTGNGALLSAARWTSPMSGNVCWYWLTRSGTGWTIYRWYVECVA